MILITTPAPNLPHFFQVIIDPFAIALQFQDLICLCIKRGITCFWAINPPLHSALKTTKHNLQFGEKWSFTDDAQWRKTILFNHSSVLIPHYSLVITIFSHFLCTLSPQSPPPPTLLPSLNMGSHEKKSSIR